MSEFDDDPELDALLTAAEAGDADAMYELGDICLAENLRPEAQSWFRKAAEAGNPAGYRGLGIVATSFQQHDDAIRFWREAIAGGDAESCLLAGTRMVADRAQYEREGLEILEHGFEAGVVACGAELGSAHLILGEPVEARQWFERAAAQREPNAARTLAAMMEASDRIDDAAVMYQFAADLGIPEALPKTEQMAGWRGDDPDELARLADEGDLDAAVAIGRSWIEAGDLQTGVEWLSDAADQGSVRALLALGDGFADAGDFEEAEHWYREAHLHGNRLGSYQLGQLLVNEGRFEEAEDLLDARRPETQLLLAEMAEMDDAPGRAEAALQRLTEIVNAVPIPDLLS